MLFPPPLCVCLCGVMLSLVEVPRCFSRPNSTDSGFVGFMNGCHKDNSPEQVPTELFNQVFEFLNGDRYAEYLLAILLGMYFFRLMSDATKDSWARFRWIRFQLLALLFRVGFANSMTPWLYTCFRQERPCYCQLSSDSEIYHFGYNLWGMPSGDCVVAAVMGCQIFEQMHWAPSLAIFLLIPVQRVVLGMHSPGQVLSGLALGILLHIYQTKTPFRLRIMDFSLNIVGAIVAFVVTKHQLPDVDYTFAVGTLNGVVWQIFAFCMFFVFHSPRRAWDLMRSSTWRVHPVQMGMTPASMTGYQELPFAKGGGTVARSGSIQQHQSRRGGADSETRSLLGAATTTSSSSSNNNNNGYSASPLQQQQQTPVDHAFEESIQQTYRASLGWLVGGVLILFVLLGLLRAVSPYISEDIPEY